MGQLVLGLVGAVAGFAIGGPFGAAVGWSVGTLAGSLLFPTKVQGPRLKDTQIQGAEYGTMRPILFGTMRIGGIGMGQGSTANGPNKFTEHEQKSGGKGGPEVTNFTYSLSFFNEICEAPVGGIAGVRKRWANGRLLTDEEVDNPDTWPYTLYLGDAEQMPDPTMEIIYGVGEVNPMRGVAYEAIEEIDVTDLGNTRPNVEYEAFTEAGDIPVRIATFRPWSEDEIGTTYEYCAVRDDNRIITVGSLNNNGTVFYRRQWLIDGTQVTASTSQIVDVGGFNYGVRNLITYWGNSLKWYSPDPDDPTTLIAGMTASDGGTAGIGISGNANIYVEPWIYCVSGDAGSGFTYITRYDAPGGVPGAYSGVRGALDTLYSNSVVGLGSSDDGSVYVWVHSGGGKFWKFDADLNLIHFWDTTDTAGTEIGSSTNVGNFFVYKNKAVIKTTIGGTAQVVLVEIDPVAFILSDTGTPLASHNSVSQYFTISIGGCLGMDEDGVFSLCPPPAPVILGDIVSSILQRDPQGLDVGQIDVSDLTQEVRGFLIGSQMTKVNAIQTLRQGFFFDVAEWDGAVHGINRGHDSIADIPDGDLGAHEPGSEPPEPLETTRTPEAELPQTVFVNYYDVDNDYQKGSQYWARQVTTSQTKTTIDLPIVLTASEALAVAQWHMYFAWLEREQFTWFTTRKWSALCPTDVVTVRGRKIRITNKTESPSGLIKWEGVLAFAGPYAPFVPLEEIPGFIPGAPGGGQGRDPPQTKAATRAVLLDIPYRTPYPFGFTAAMVPSEPGSWPGASLYKSLDDGVTYNPVATAFSPATIGTAADALDDYTGGTALDTVSGAITIMLAAGSPGLESCTSDALDNGANLCALRSGSGWELLQFQNATLTAANTYEISQPYYRGRNGSDGFNAGHAAGDTFVLLPAVAVDAPENELNVALKYKAVTFGTAIADTAAIEFTNTGLSNSQWAGNPPIPPKPITAGTYTILSSDRGKLLSFNNAGGVAVTLPQAGASFPNGWFVYVQNTGVGDVVITPTTSTIDGASSLTLTTGQGALITSNGTNYYTTGSTTSAPPAVPTGTGYRHITAGVEDGAAVALSFQIEWIIGDGTNPILTGLYPTAVIRCPRAGTVTGWEILSCDAASPTAGSITIDLWKDTYTNYPPDVSNTMIPTGTKPFVTANATKNTGSTLTGWTTSIVANDNIFINVDAVTLFKAVKVVLFYTSTG